jgi:hypothetical protein
MEILLLTYVEQIKDAAGSARFFGVIAQRLERPPVSRNVWGSNPHSLVPINQTTMTTATFRLTGDSLVNFVNQEMVNVNRGEVTRTDMILAAGYQYDNGKAMYTEFYTELLRAKGVTPVTDTDVNEDLYDNLSSDEQALFDAVDEKFGEKWSVEEVIEFMKELDDIGIETASDFEDRFYGVYDSEKEFAEYFCVEVMNAQIPDIVYAAVDWQAVYDHNLRYDFNCVEFDYGYYFFSNY